MGRSTTAELIQRAKLINEFNNHAVPNDTAWITHFNTALQQMTDDLKLENTTTITTEVGVEEYDLPEDFYAMKTLTESKPVPKRRAYEQEYPPGYWVLNKGSKHVLSLKGYLSPVTMTLYYFRYPDELRIADKDTQQPDVPTMAEQALVYMAVGNALRNNTQLGQAQYYDELYRREIARANTAWQRARG